MTEIEPSEAEEAQPAAGVAPEPRGRPMTIVARIVAVAIPALICLSGIAFAGMMVATRPTAARTTSDVRGIPVRVAEATLESPPVHVHANGQVLAAQRVVMSPELNGRVVWMNENLVPGGRVAAGDRLIRIDASDFRAALEQQRAQVENQRLSVSQETSRRVIAEREWALLQNQRGGGSAEGERLALRTPHQRSAEASLRAAESSVRQARTNLRRTTLTAPFDAVIQSENVDLGQLVGPSSQVATLIGTEHFWVQVSIPLEQLRWIEVPGSIATVTQTVGEDETIERTGRVLRVLGDLDPVGRMARLLVEIDDPLGDAAAAEADGPERTGSRLPMLIGAYVTVEIEAGRLENVVEVPRTALHAGDVVHLLGDGSRLEVRTVEVVWRRDSTVLVRGIGADEGIVLSAIPTPIEGTLLRRLDEEPAEASATAAPARPAPSSARGTEPETP